jgi:hypothetical protein
MLTDAGPWLNQENPDDVGAVISENGLYPPPPPPEYCGTFSTPPLTIAGPLDPVVVRDVMKAEAGVSQSTPPVAPEFAVNTLPSL